MEPVDIKGEGKLDAEHASDATLVADAAPVAAAAPAVNAVPVVTAAPVAGTEHAPETRFRVHHSYMWLGVARATLSVFVALFFVSLGLFINPEPLRIGGTSIPASIAAPMVFGAVLVVTVIVLAVVQVLSYRHLWYELGEEEFSLYSGVFNKKRVHVPYQRIQSVNEQASLLERIFGVCTVHIDTAGGSANKAVVVSYLQNAQAEQLRGQLFARKRQAAERMNAAAGASAVAMQAGAGGMTANVLDMPAEIWNDVRGVFGGAAVDTGTVTFEYGLSNKELVFTGLSNNTAFILVVIGVLASIAQFAGDVAPFVSRQAEPLVGSFVAVSAQLFGGNLIAAIIAAVLACAIVAWFVSIVATCLAYGGFRACRRDNRIEVERGLLQRRFQGVDIDRVQSVVIKQSFIRRLLGYCELSLGKIDAAAEGSDGQKQSLNPGGLIVHPFVKMDRVSGILAGLVPEFADVPTESTPVAPVALRRSLIRRCVVQGGGFWLAVATALVQVSCALFVPVNEGTAFALYWVGVGVVISYALAAALFLLDGVCAVLWFRGSSFAWNDRFMQVSNGGFSRESISFPRKKIQYGFTKTNPFQRRAKTMTINARTAAGIGGTTIRLIDVCEEDARQWLDWLKPKGNVIQ